MSSRSNHRRPTRERTSSACFSEHEKRSRQAQKIVEKWEAKLTELDRAGVAAKQARLWQEEHLQEIGIANIANLAK